MVIIEKQDEGIVITNQETGKRAVLRVSENARWCCSIVTALLVAMAEQFAKPTTR